LLAQRGATTCGGLSELHIEMLAAVSPLTADLLPAHASGRTLEVGFTRLEKKRGALLETI